MTVIGVATSNSSTFICPTTVSKRTIVPVTPSSSKYRVRSRTVSEAPATTEISDGSSVTTGFRVWPVNGQAARVRREKIEIGRIMEK